MAWCQKGKKISTKPMMTYFTNAYMSLKLQWVKQLSCLGHLQQMLLSLLNLSWAIFAFIQTYVTLHFETEILSLSQLCHCFDEFSMIHAVVSSMTLPESHISCTNVCVFASQVAWTNYMDTLESNVNIDTPTMMATHTGMDKNVAMLQRTFSHPFSWNRKCCDLIKLSLNNVCDGPVDNGLRLVSSHSLVLNRHLAFSSTSNA